jgi:hypothetical protein
MDHVSMTSSLPQCPQDEIPVKKTIEIQTCRIKRSNSWTKKSRVCQAPWSPADTLLNPQPYEHLYAERAYLVSTLQQHTAKIMDLVQQHWQATEQPPEYSPVGNDRRRSRKKQSALRSKLHEAVSQKNVALLRLSELELELQSRDAWLRARDEATSYFDFPSPDTTFSGPFVMTDVSASTSTCTTPLNAISPSFVPGPKLYQDFGTQERHSSSRESSVTGMKLDTVDEASEQFSSNHGLTYEYRCGGDAELIEKQTPSWDGVAIVRYKRKQSLPNLGSLWPTD